MADRRYWVGVAARDHVELGVAGGFAMFAHGRHEAITRLAAGDRFAYYAPMTGMRSGEPVRAFVAIGEVLSADPELWEMAPGSSGWRRSVQFVPSKPADVYPLLSSLSFLRDPSHWGMAFRRSLFEVSQIDFRRIAAAMEADFNEEGTT